ncbi:hypothetical protein [Microvirga massiliensis]|uniref:hypothetical protein n=1 Tax=Microvirga massiliensis TaxID=1033741 RepID=UPI000B0B4C91|nr:hypothetical protein [Microvirga massiliensis]
MTVDPNNCEDKANKEPHTSQLKIIIPATAKFIVVMAGFAIAAMIVSASQIAGQGMTPVGAWEVQHGNLHIVYAFTNDGTYTYQRFGTGRDEEETGVYSVRGDRLIIKPNSGPQRAFRWKIGCDPATACTPGIPPVLFLEYPDGRKEFFYPQ